MNQADIKWVITELAERMGHEFNETELRKVDLNPQEYGENDFREFIHHLNEFANRIKMVFLEHSVDKEALPEFLDNIGFPIMAFAKNKSEGIDPVILYSKGGKPYGDMHHEDSFATKTFDLESIVDLQTNEKGEVIYLAAFSYESLVSEEEDETGEYAHLTPVSRLVRLLSNERKDILYVYIYAVIIGLVSLSLPLGIQAIVQLVSSGMLFNTVLWLIAFVLIGILVTGGLQIMQISIVEVIQRRVFTKAAFEFAFRVPRLRVESILNQHVPELMNRFFDVLTIQKGLPKLLVDLSGALLQILFGLILLAFYHPFFVFFGLGLVTVLVLVFYWTGPAGLRSSIMESKYKYKVVYWLEELARTVNSFKLAGNTHLPMKKADDTVNNYLKNRTIHFRILISQFSYIILFKFFVTGGMLIIGSLLVIDRQITLGMFVASEIIIILILISVEKIITYMDVIYDLLTAVDKIGHVTDLPLERYGGIRFINHNNQNSKGFSIHAKGLSYKYKGHKNPTISNIDLDVKAGERICVTGFNSSGKSTFLNVLAGIYNDYEGIVTMNNVSLRDFDLISLRNSIAKNISTEDIFEGTIMENITVGKANTTYPDVMWALESVGLNDQINALPEGLNTMLNSAGKTFSASMVNKMILARCLAQKPQLLILNDFFHNFQKTEKLRLINFLADPKHPWTLIASSDDPIILGACDKIVLMKEGTIAEVGTFKEIQKTKMFNEIAYTA
ncbi:MAG: ATP-binding cassette domain-containing protein [Cyclobacteriaceae bacterium]